MVSQSIEFFIYGEALSSQELKERLENDLKRVEAPVGLELREDTFRVRNVDPMVLVALVGVAGTGLGALITGLFKIAEETRNETIVLQGKDFRLEIPANTSMEKLDQLIEKLKAMNTGQIYVNMR
jgi:hypothetical protein